MPKPLTIELTPEQQQELEYARDHHEKPYVRERAAAILKIAAGMSGRQVALHGLLKRRHPDTIYAWVRRYLAEGIAGLLIRPGRGRKPAFSPSALGRGGGSPGHPAGCATGASSLRLSPKPLDFDHYRSGLSLATGDHDRRSLSTTGPVEYSLQAGSQLHP